jgi:hypothetical protein
MAGKEHPLTAEPFITEQMENWEPGPRCEGCGSPGTFHGGICYGCLTRWHDDRRLAALVDAARAEILGALTSCQMDDDAMRRLVRAQADLATARDRLRH